MQKGNVSSNQNSIFEGLEPPCEVVDRPVVTPRGVELVAGGDDESVGSRKPRD